MYSGLLSQNKRLRQKELDKFYASLYDLVSGYTEWYGRRNYLRGTRVQVCDGGRKGKKINQSNMKMP